MLISRAVTLKSRVTPALRAQLGAETQKAIRDAEEQFQRLSAECERVRLLGKADQASALEKEAQGLSARREALTAKLREVAKLREGQEVTRGQIQGFYDLKVGDVWSSVQSCDIVLEDGKVIAIREGSAVTVTVNPEDGPEEPGL